MGLEVELKFHCQDLGPVRSRLQKQQADFVEKNFETNMVFDTRDLDLRRKNFLLRLRLTERAVLCLKIPPGKVEHSDVKTWQEYETQVKDPDQMQAILQGLGYLLSFKYEKFREKWSFRSCLVCLDILPFGRFVEIEGQREQIFACAEDLGLAKETATTATYHDLNKKFQRSQGLPEDDSFVFTGRERDSLVGSS